MGNKGGLAVLCIIDITQTIYCGFTDCDLILFANAKSLIEKECFYHCRPGSV